MSSSQSVQNVSAEVSRRQEEAGQQQTQAQQEYARATDLNTAAKDVSLARLQGLKYSTVYLVDPCRSVP